MADSDPEIQFRDGNQDLGQGDADSAIETDDFAHGQSSQVRRRTPPVRARSMSPFREYRGRSPRLAPIRRPKRYSSASPENRPDFSPYSGSQRPDRHAQTHRNRDASRHCQGPTLKPDPYSGEEN